MPTISIGFNETTESPKNIMISMEVPIQENEHIWVWDHYFSFVLHRLSDKDEADQLLNTLAAWSTGFSKNMALSFEEVSNQNLLNLSQEIAIKSHLNDCSELFFIEVTPQNGYWPGVHFKVNDQASAQNLHDSVLALAQFFLFNNAHFYRDLPLHMLAMRKFYQNETPYSNEDSVGEAPAYAFDVALKFIKSLEPTD